MVDREVASSAVGRRRSRELLTVAAMFLPYEANGNSPIVASGDSECGLHSGKKVFYWLRAHTSNGG